MNWNWWRIGLCGAPYLVFLIEWVLLIVLVKPRRVVRRGLFLIGLAAASKFVGFSYWGGNAFNPDLPLWVLMTWGWFESILWCGLPAGFAVLVLAGLVRPFRRFVLPATLLLSALLATYGMWEGARIPPVIEREVAFADLPSAFDGYRIVHVSDLHCSSAARREKIAGIVARINACRPDLVAITGDFVDGTPRERADDLAPLADLRAADGVVACAGNHEKYWKIAQWEPHFRQWRVGLLRNAWRRIDRGGQTLVVGGLDDISLGARPKQVFKDAPEGTFRILLFHRPVWCAANAHGLGVRLQLSGHTHGGAMPIIDRFVARKNEGHLRGLYHEGSLKLHLSPGTGQWAGFPLRLFNPPEITSLTLRRRTE